MGGVRLLGGYGLRICQRLAHALFFLFRVLFQRWRWSQVRALGAMQFYRVGVLSVLVIVLSGCFIGMVVALQGFNTLQKFSAESQLGKLLALSVVRELGPVITALLFVGRAGSALTAEVGLMRATDQFKAMEVMGTNPLWRVIAPRFWAALICCPILTVLFNVAAILGGQLVSVGWLGVHSGTFWSGMQAATSFRVDVMGGLYKSMVFGFLIAWIALYQGSTAQPTSLGIGVATTRTVVLGSVLVLAFDFILTGLMMGGW